MWILQPAVIAKWNGLGGHADIKHQIAFCMSVFTKAPYIPFKTQEWMPIMPWSEQNSFFPTPHLCITWPQCVISHHVLYWIVALCKQKKNSTVKPLKTLSQQAGIWMRFVINSTFNILSKLKSPSICSQDCPRSACFCHCPTYFPGALFSLLTCLCVLWNICLNLT